MKWVLFSLTIVLTVAFVVHSHMAVLAEDSSDPFEVAAAQITPPDPSLPQEVRDFFGTNGKWRGTMNWLRSKQDTALIIKSMTASEARVYCNLTRYSVEDAIGRFSVGDDGRTRLIIPIPVGLRTSDLVLYAQKSGLTGTIGSLTPLFWPVKK
jgi:hypothetical protein